MSVYHAVELAITGLAVAGSAAFVLRGWARKLFAGRRGASSNAGGCASCNDCGACAPAAPPREAPIRLVRRAR
jgi:hypothetical protein